MDDYTANATLGNFQDALFTLVDQARAAGLSGPAIRAALQTQLNARPKSEDEFWHVAGDLAEQLQRAARDEDKVRLLDKFRRENSAWSSDPPFEHKDTLRRETLLRLLVALSPFPF
jgi:hypothetical protein